MIHNEFNLMCAPYQLRSHEETVGLPPVLDSSEGVCYKPMTHGGTQRLDFAPMSALSSRRQRSRKVPHTTPSEFAQGLRGPGGGAHHLLPDPESS
jgi:hypothetical protein